MPEFTHLFNAGKMNKDLDERLVPQGEYRDALNLDLANSENGNSGSLQNVEGNTQLRKNNKNLPWVSNYIDQLDNAKCIGVYRNDINEKIYWFIAAPTHGTGKFGISAIAEYNQVSGTISPVLVDTKGILKFNETYLITGINIIDKFLFWTDNQTEPKKINIDKFKTGSVNFVTHTKIPIYNQEAEVYQSNIIGQPDFLEEDITVIKKSPLNPPILDMGASKFGADIPGTGVDYLRTEYGVNEQQNFTYRADLTQDPPSQPIPIDTYGQYLANIAGDPDYYANSSLGANWNGEITFDILAPPSYGIVDGQAVWQDGDVLSLRASYIDDFNNQYEYQARFLIVTNGVNGDSITVRIQSISSDVNRFFNEDGDDLLIAWEVILEEKTPLFEYNFPRFAYRWKYIDNEYSCFSPFSEVAFIPNKFKYISSDGYNIGMTNNIRKLIVSDFSWGSEEVIELDILYKADDSNAVYVVDTIKRNDSTLLTGNLVDYFEIKNELIGSIVESNQLLRPWDNVPLKAKAQEIIGNRIVYGNYLQNYTVGSIRLDTQILSSPHPSRVPEYLVPGSESQYTNNQFTGDAEPSLKSIRTYQVGVVYKDEFGRETPVFSSQNSSTYIDISESCEVTKLATKIFTAPPPFATHYKYFVKETSTPYYNLALDRFYPAEDGNIWLSFPSSERNKLDEETYLILKKQHDNSEPVKDLNRYKILAIENEAPDFVSNFKKTLFSGTVKLLTEAGPGFLTVRVEGPSLQSNPNFGNNLSSANQVIFEKGGFETNAYGIEKAGSAYNSAGGNNPVIYSIKLKDPLAGDASWMENLSTGDNIDITIFIEEPKSLPEFEGRFFAKINRDFAFDENIIKTFSALQKRYVVLDEIKPFLRTAEGETNVNNFKYFWLDTGNRHDNDCFTCECASNWSQYQSQGPGAWGGVGTSLNTIIRENYKPPMQYNQWFGYSFVGQLSGYIDDFSGTASGGFGQMGGAYFDAGSYIRFVNNSTGDYSKVYQIQEAYQQGRLGGREACAGVCCGGGLDNQAQDQRVAFVAKLNETLKEDWFPSSNGDTGTLISSDISMQIVTDVYDGDNKILTSTNPAVFETEPKETADLDLYYEASKSFEIAQHGLNYDPIDWYNVYSFGNGAESNRVRDDFNAKTINKGVKVSTVLDEPYALEHRGSGFIYSQLYNSTSGINRLNQFIQAEKITKDLNPTYGTIQKLHARDTDLIALCEDKCFRVLANKDALYNADGNVNLTGNNAVLGQTIPYVGDYGISKNPESFASYAFRSYFTDKNRGAVIRLSRDGITVISEQGMNDFFSDNLSSSTKIIGSYDEDKGLYNVTLNSLTPYWRKHLSVDKDYNLTAECPTSDSPAEENLILETTVSFDEQVKGWTSRKSFIPEGGVSLNNTYYTFKNALIWEHGLNDTYNNFYGDQYFSTVNLLINDSPQAVKGYTALNYSGSASRELEYEYNNNWYSIAEVNAGSFVPGFVQVKREGWYSNFIRTNLESGEIKEFENKEGKYFNHIKALEVCKKGKGIGTGTIDPVEQDYILTSGLSCEGLGQDCEADPVPDTLIDGWWQWNTKGLSSSILNESQASSAKCIIEDFHLWLAGNYSEISSINYDQFKYIFEEGLTVGTQLYDKDTLEPISEPGTYLFISNTAGPLPDAPALDPSNPATVPNAYMIVMVTPDGIIQSMDQYNTLPPCDEDPDVGPMNLFRGYYNNVQSYVMSGGITSAICGMRDSITTWTNSPLEICGPLSDPPPNCKGRGTFSKGVYWYSSQSADLQEGVTIYTYNSAQEVYTPYANTTAMWKSPNGGTSVAYVQALWDDLSLFGDEWYFIETDENGTITTMTQVNTIEDPTC